MSSSPETPLDIAASVLKAEEDVEEAKALYARARNDRLEAWSVYEARKDDLSKRALELAQETEHEFAKLAVAAEKHLTMCRSVAIPTSPVATKANFDEFLSASPLICYLRRQGCIRSCPTSSPSLALEEKRDTSMRKKSAKHYGSYKKIGNRAKCSVTGVWGNPETVIGAHLLPLGTTPSNIQKALRMEGMLNDFRNLVPLLKTIEEAYDHQRLSIIVKPGTEKSAKKKYQLKILDPSLRQETYHGAKKFEQLEYVAFKLPLGKNGRFPFTRALSFHAQVSHSFAIEKGWIQKSEKPPMTYGTPIDNGKLSFAVDSPSSSRTTSPLGTPAMTFDEALDRADSEI